MKNKCKLKIIIITFGMIFALLTINNFKCIDGNNYQFMFQFARWRNIELDGIEIESLKDAFVFQEGHGAVVRDVVASTYDDFVFLGGVAFPSAQVEAIGDVVIAPPVKLEKYGLLIERLEQTKTVEAATAMLSNQGLLHLGKGNVRAVIVWGIEPGQREKVPALSVFCANKRILRGSQVLRSPRRWDKLEDLWESGWLPSPTKRQMSMTLLKSRR